MIKGFATRSATARLAATNRAVAYNQTSPGGLYTSQAGFGCYRVSAGMQAHADALQAALSRGVNLISEFTSLETIWKMVRRLSATPHFRMIQMPLNLLEKGAVLEKNQSREASVLAFARDNNLAV